MNTYESAIKATDIHPDMPPLETLELDRGADPSASVICLHDLIASSTHELFPDRSI